ncbi:MAG: branched-chain amino acid ABC transporter permease [Chloroflexota bacterium]|nr:branched-chain amino acid ABC transporter permease [Chloroflexota bacterium]MDQ5865511.1 branched-chain amino acid ABC transporter permease [Chloroflexota bacterium]
MLEFYNNNSFLINLVGINAIMALSIYITLSCAMLSLSNAASMAIGAYTAALLTQQAGWPLWLAVVAAAAVAGLVALVLGMPILRLRGVFLAIATLGFGEVIRIIIVNTPALGGPEGFRLNAGNRSGVVTGVEIFGTLLVLAYFFARLKGSRMGLAMDAIREDENAARTMGINVTFYKVMAYVTGAVVAGIGGALYAHLRSFLSPGDFGFQRAVDILVFAVVGGTFAWRGAILGAALITLLPEITRSVPVVAGLNIKDHPEIFSGLILLLVILFLPKGLLTFSLGLKLRRPAPRTLEKEASP